MRQETAADAARGYAARGWPVVPLWAPERLKPDEKVHPSLRDWNERRALRTEREVSDWWIAHPSDGVGILTGPESAVGAVLDVDPRHGGDRSLAELIDEYGSLPPTPEAISGGGGTHFLFRAERAVGDKNGLRDGIDRKSGGLLICAPSWHPSGGRYAWRVHPSEIPLADAPAWFLNLTKRPRTATKRARTARAGRTGTGSVPEGERTDAMKRLAIDLARGGPSGNLQGEELLAALELANDALCEPPLTQEEIERLATWKGLVRLPPVPPLPHILTAPAGPGKSARRLFEYLWTLWHRPESRELGYCWASYRTIHKRTGMSPTTIAKAIRELEDHGLLLVDRVPSPTQGRSNRYRLYPFGLGS